VTNVLSANLVTDCYTQRRRENSPKSEKRYSTKIGTSCGSGEYYNLSWLKQKDKRNVQIRGESVPLSFLRRVILDMPYWLNPPTPLHQNLTRFATGSSVLQKNKKKHSYVKETIDNASLGKLYAKLKKLYWKHLDIWIQTILEAIYLENSDRYQPFQMSNDFWHQNNPLKNKKTSVISL